MDEEFSNNFIGCSNYILQPISTSQELVYIKFAICNN